MMRIGAFLAVGFALLLVQSNLYRVLTWTHVPGLIPSLVLPLIVFMGVHEYSLPRGAAVAFVLGYVTDLWGIAPVGLYTFTYVALFVLARAAGVRLAAQTMMMRVGLAFAFAAVQSATVLVLVAIFGRDPWVPRALIGHVLPHAFATAAVAPAIFRVAERIHTATASGHRAGVDGAMP